MLFLVSLDLLDGTCGGAANATSRGSGQVLLQGIRFVKVRDNARLADGCGHGKRLTI